MIKKYTDFLNEKLTDKLSGFNVNDLKINFLDGKISINNFKKLCNKYNLELPTEDEILENIKHHSDDIRFVFKYAVMNENLDGIKYAVEHGANVNIGNNFAISMFVLNNNLEISKYLIEHGANVNYDGDYLLSNSISAKYYDMTKLLLDNGAKITDDCLKLDTTDEIKQMLKQYYDKEL